MNKYKYQRKQFIKKLHHQGISHNKIGKILGISHQRVHQILTDYASPSSRKSHGIVRKLPKELTFIDKPTNTAGLGNLTGREFTREAVRIRDRRRCQICFKRWKREERKFDIHHLGRNCGKKSRSYDRISEAPRLITLCHLCHLSLDTVRKKMSESQKKLYRGVVLKSG